MLRAQLRQALAEVAKGSVRVDVTVLPLADAARAHELLKTRASRAKYVPPGPAGARHRYRTRRDADTGPEIAQTRG
ncbi:zinc-binding dehydrogenase [Streptomyces sp. NPDC060030]|uniref:zinc-binding dehydrogenase n=1 Tax=Streptomyces sp. NPDC060030 TaxID=3347042 RepID=UPI0036C69145